MRVKIEYGDKVTYVQCYSGSTQGCTMTLNFKDEQSLIKAMAAVKSINASAIERLTDELCFTAAFFEAEIPNITFENTHPVFLGCIKCDSEVEIQLTEEQCEALELKELSIQKIMPEIDPTIRERLISGLCDECFHKVMGHESDN